MKKTLNKVIHGKLFIVILIMLFTSVSLLIGTYAWFTWSSTDNTKLVLSIGRMADVIFSSGNDINSELKPVFNYNDGLSTNFTINNRDTSGAYISYTVSLNIDNIANELISNSVKWTLVKNGAVVKEGNLLGASNNNTISLYNEILSTGTTSYEFYLYIDGNVENNPNMMGKTITGNIMVEAYNNEPTTLSDFEYYLGSEHPTVTSIKYYYEYGNEITPVESYAEIPLAENEILLTRYIGNSESVFIPDTYDVNGVTYNVILLSTSELNDDYNYRPYSTGGFYKNKNIKSILLGNNIKAINYYYYHYAGEEESSGVNKNSMNSAFYECTNLVNVPVIPNSVTSMGDTFYGCTSLVNAPVIPSSVTSMSSTFSGCTSLVSAPAIPNSVTYMNSTFRGCTSLVNAPVIPSSVTSMSSVFYGCTSLVNAPVIPDSVTSMSSTFSGCTSLVNAPVIPDSVTSMSSTFSGCISLVNAPVIPDSVTNMDSTFSGCTNLVNAPVIPNSVTNMNYTFGGCTNLTGTVRINSSNVTNINNIFRNTSKAITVEVPAGSTTYTKISALTTSNGMPSNVTLSTY